MHRTLSLLVLLPAVADAGATWRARRWIDLTLQAILRDSLYDSNIEMLGQPAIAFLVGGRFRLSEHADLAVAVGEDIKVGSTPDVTFQLTFSYCP